MSVSQTALQVASTQIGVQEIPKGSNGGPQVTQYLKSVGLGPGNPWCMAFVYWCVNEASKQLGVENPLVKTGSVMFQYNNTKLRKLPKTSSAVKPGDVFVMEFSAGKGHTGFVTAIENGMIHTIEGNSNSDHSREGFEVISLSRPVSTLKGFIQLP